MNARDLVNANISKKRDESFPSVKHLLDLGQLFMCSVVKEDERYLYHLLALKFYNIV